MKAGALTPAIPLSSTPAYADIPRSMKAGALTPAILVDLPVLVGVQHRSMKAGALTPAIQVGGVDQVIYHDTAQ